MTCLGPARFLAGDRAWLRDYPFLATHNRLLIGLHGDARFTSMMDDLRIRWEALRRATRSVTPA